MTPRDYQAEIDIEIDKAFAEGHQRILVVLPTGGGKTVIFTLRAAKNYIRNIATLITVNRNELIVQTNDKLTKNGVQSMSIIPGNQKIHPNCNVASIETLARRMAKNKVPPVDQMICDEIHIRQHDKIINKFPYAQVIGFTGTPHRPGRTGLLGEMFTKIIEVRTARELVEAGWLVPNITYAAKEDFPEPELDKKTGDYDAKDMFQKMDKPSLYAGVIDQYRKYANGTSAICFNANVEHSLKMTRIFNDAGISAKHVDGNTEKGERRRILEQHRNREFDVLCNCGVFTTGFDGPYIGTIILNRKTASLPLYLQMGGRGSRALCNVDQFPDDPAARRNLIAASSKPMFTILDHGSNAKRFGLWVEDRDWSGALEPPKKRNDTGGVSAVKECLNPDCGALIPASARVCPYCEAEAPVTASLPVDSEGFIEVKARELPEHLNKKFSEMTIEELEERREFGSNGKPWKQGWVNEQFRLRAKARGMEEMQQKSCIPNVNQYYQDLLEEYARMKGYNKFWCTKQGRCELDILGISDAPVAAPMDFFKAKAS